MFSITPDDKWELISTSVDSFTALVTLIAAVAAWRAATASKHAVKEMAAARHQYVKPVLILRSSPIDLDLGVWRKTGAGIPNFDAKIAITNVGKGPAYDVDLTYHFEGEKRIAAQPIDLAAINKLLSTTDLSVEDQGNAWLIQKNQDGQFSWSVPKSNYLSNEKFPRIAEDETVYLDVSSGVIGLEVLHCLNAMALDPDDQGKFKNYVRSGFWFAQHCDKLEISFRSITEESQSLQYHAIARGGMYGANSRLPFSPTIELQTTIISPSKG